MKHLVIVGLFAAGLLLVLSPVRVFARQASVSETIELLKARIEKQQSEIDRMRADLEAQRALIEQLDRDDNRVASLTPSIPPAVALQSNIDDLTKKVDAVVANLGGFKFSGDFRLRADAQLRSGNDVAPPLQNVRSRYRLRINADKDIDPKFRFHMQLSTGPLSNGITNDQDMAGIIDKHPFSIAEAYVDFHPAPRFSIRGGRMEEVFADNMRFLWDDDIRFNGFHQILAFPFNRTAGKAKMLEFRAGEYFLSNPNVTVLAAGSPFLAAGYITGQKVRDSNLFHPGLMFRQDLGTIWSHQLGTDIQLYRNVNQIQLSSTANAFPILINSALGIALSGPLPGAGNATTTPGGAIYTATKFRILRATYRVQHKGLNIAGREMPLYLDLQIARNIEAPDENNAAMVSLNLGNIRGRKNVRFLYQFAIKEANSLVSQFTDDDLGTGSGVNIRVHAIRGDVGLTRFLQWQNLFFIQNQVEANNPARQFFVPLQAGARTTYRYLGQLAFTF